MQSMVQAILTVAADAKVDSIALPLLGCGQAGWPIALAAKAQIAELVEAALTGSAGSTLKVSLHTANANDFAHIAHAHVKLQVHQNKCQQIASRLSCVVCQHAGTGPKTSPGPGPAIPLTVTDAVIDEVGQCIDRGAV